MVERGLATLSGQNDSKPSIFRIGAVVVARLTSGRLRINRGCTFSQRTDSISRQTAVERVVGRIDFFEIRIVRKGQNLSVGRDQLDDRVEVRIGLVDIEPNFRATKGIEAVDVHIRGLVDHTLDLESESSVLVSAVDRTGQLPQILSLGRIVVGAGCVGKRRFSLGKYADVTIVRIRLHRNASPRSRGSDRGDGRRNQLQETCHAGCVRRRSDLPSKGRRHVGKTVDLS